MSRVQTLFSKCHSSVVLLPESRRRKIVPMHNHDNRNCQRNPSIGGASLNSLALFYYSSFPHNFFFALLLGFLHWHVHIQVLFLVFRILKIGIVFRNADEILHS